MKLKYIMGMALTALLATACSDDDQVIGTFDDISVSSSYLSIAETGGNASVTIKAQA